MRGNYHESIADDLEAFLRDRFQIPQEDRFFTRTAHLWDEGYVDSAGIVQTIAYLEERHGVTLPSEVLQDPAFTHVDGIARTIAKLLDG